MIEKPFFEVLEEACGDNEVYPGIPDMAPSDWAIVLKCVADKYVPKELPYGGMKVARPTAQEYARVARQNIRQQILNDAKIAEKYNK